MKPLITGALGVLLCIGAGTGAYAEPRFKLEALSFKAIDESGYDRLGSDEVKVDIIVPHLNSGASSTVLTVTKEFENVDAGDRILIPFNQRCILPIAGLNATDPFIALRGDEGDTWSCDPNGAPGPFSFTVRMHEIDWDCEWASCELIGQRDVIYSLEELTALRIGQELEETVTLGGLCGHERTECGGATGPMYTFTWRLTRLGDRN